MMDPFGNYLIQKLLDRCSEEQRLQVLKRAAEKGELVSVALNTHGTRAVQKLIETLTSREQRAIVIEALAPGVVPLIKDLNGNHVVQRCLQRLGPDDSQFVYDAARTHCVEVATHRHGCCVLQRCVDFATPAQKSALVAEIARHALVLSQDAFGNYVVQYVLELGQDEASGGIIQALEGHYGELAMQKFSSNVVEKCLKLGGLDALRHGVVREITASPLLPRLLQDSYGNYVVQSALAVSNGPLHNDLVEAIRPYMASLRGTPHGKRILQKMNGKA
ncbi:MAG: pumilio family protein [Monoraphidium minutum]|nr:MAG: pumilio family protein [Monoraphidium minutum]